MNTVTIRDGCLYIIFDFGLPLRKAAVTQLYKMHIQHVTKI